MKIPLRLWWCLLLVFPAGRLVAKEWPFAKPVAGSVPQVMAVERIRNPIDSFVLQKLEEKDLTIAPEASRQTLVRRLYFDLIGLPPSPDEVHAFVGDEDPAAYEKLVDRLLGDPRYGERWARFWLTRQRGIPCSWNN